MRGEGEGDVYDDPPAGVPGGGHSCVRDSQQAGVLLGSQRDVRTTGGGRDGAGAAVSDQHSAGV